MIFIVAKLLFVLTFLEGVEPRDCDIPFVLRGTWFYRENGEYANTEINADSMTGRGTCLSSYHSHHVNYTMVYYDAQTTCYHCVKYFVRTVNIVDKIESGCKTLRDRSPSLNSICDGINPEQQLITLFAENFVPVNCRSGLEAVEFSCLGDWFVGKNHYFAVANTKESRKDEKFRCFLKNRDDDDYMGKSITPECNTLKSPEDSPERYRMTPVKSELVTPGCNLPLNFSGNWINTANIDADVFINQTHIVETWHPDIGRSRKTVYICKESRDTRILLTRLNVDGW
nr:EOG090X03AK [Chydorus sphaericus]